MPPTPTKIETTMDNFIVWAIIALFYAPLHYLVPMLIVFFRNVDDEQLRKKRLIATAIDCTISMSLGFALVIFLAEQNLQTAMIILLLSMFTPYIRLFLRKQRTVEEV